MKNLEELELRCIIEQREAKIYHLERDLREARQKLHEMEQLDTFAMFDIWSEDSIFGILCHEMHEAKLKHPDFTPSLSGAVSIITEELGELAQVINDKLADLNGSCASPTWREQAMIEAAHVAVTAIRTMHLLKERG